MKTPSPTTAPPQPFSSFHESLEQIPPEAADYDDLLRTRAVLLSLLTRVASFTTADTPDHHP